MITSETSIHVDFLECSIKDLVNGKIIYSSNHSSMEESYLNQFKYWLKSIEKNKVKLNSIEEAIKVSDVIL